MVLELCEFKIYILASEAKFDLEVKDHFEKKVANLIYEVDRKRFIRISRTVLYLYAFVVYILASEVKVGLGGQRS